MDNSYVAVNKALIARIIGTLKSLDVRGFESMDSLVGTVIVLENLMNEQTDVSNNENCEDK